MVIMRESHANFHVTPHKVVYVYIATHFFLTDVNRLSHGGKEKLQDKKQRVQTLADETAIALKKNVYKNYSQFIETAKEISSILFHM